MIQAIAPFVLKHKGILKLAAVAVIVLGIIATVAWAINRIYQQGYEAGNAKADATITAAKLRAEIERNEAQAKLIATERAMRALEQDAAKRIADARSEGEVQVKTVERVIRENPDFAVIKRPADLQRVRDDQLAAIRAAAERSTAATQLPATGLHGLPSTGDPNRDDSGRNGSR